MDANDHLPVRRTKAQLLAYLRGVDVTTYADRRNYLGESTELSEYISRGVISLPEIRAIILSGSNETSAYKLLNELAWREYWQLTWRVRGDDIFEYIRPLHETRRPGIPLAVIHADTGIKAIDDGIKQLQRTGYIHNHMRMWIAGLICNIAQCDWKTGADWMHSYLIDGDYASNHLSWQWVAGSYTGKPYLPQQNNINTYSKTMQHGSYLDLPYEVLDDMPVPDQLQTTTTTLPVHKSILPVSTVTFEQLATRSQILLYSPWTLDPSWRTTSPSTRVLVLDSDMYRQGRFSQNVLGSILWYGHQIPDIKLYVDHPSKLKQLSSHIVRKDYPGITNWPGQIDPTEKLFPKVPDKFYPSFSSFWKVAQKSQ